MNYRCDECGFMVVGVAGDDDDYEAAIDLAIEQHEQLHTVDVPLVAQVGHAADCDCRGCCERRGEPAPVAAWSSQAGLAAFRHGRDRGCAIGVLHAHDGVE